MFTCKLAPQDRANRRDRTGFTLIELLLVLAILVVLASMVVTMFSGTQERALKDAAKGQVGIFRARSTSINFIHETIRPI